MDTVQQVVFDGILDVIKKNQIDVNSPFSVITKGMEIINGFKHLNGFEKRALLVKVLREVAAGKDKVAGTADDLLPASVIESIQQLLDAGLVEDYAVVLKDVVKGKFDFNKTVEVAAKTLPFCFALCGGSKK